MLHIRPWYIAAWPPSSTSRPSVLLWDKNDFTTLYHLDDTIGPLTLLNGSTQGWSLTYFETRPQISERNLVWIAAYNRTSDDPPAYDQALLAFDATTLRLLRTFLLPTFVPAPRLVSVPFFFCTDSTGTLYLSMGEFIYVLNPTTGAQVRHFQLPIMDQQPVTYSHGGYYIGFTKEDILWAVDSAWVNQTLGMMRCSSNGTLLGQAYVEMPYTAQNQLQGFAVDSAGNGYITLYADDELQSRAYVISPSFTVSFLAAPFTGGYSNHDVEISIAWGRTPAEDVIVQFDYATAQIWMQHPAGDVVSFINPVGSSGLLFVGAMAHDTFQDSLVISYGSGVARMSMEANLLVIYPVVLPFSTSQTVSVAVDGFGHVLVSIRELLSPFSPIDLQLFSANGGLLLNLVNATQSTSIALDGTRSLIWTAQLNGLETFALQSLSYTTGRPTQTLPPLSGYPQNMAPYDSTHLAVLIYNSQAKQFNSVYLVETSTGAQTLLVAVDSSSSFFLASTFSLSLDHSLVYFYGRSVDLRQSLGYIVSVASGELFAAAEPAYSNAAFNAQTQLCASSGALLIWEPFTLPSSSGSGSGGSALSGGAIAGIVVAVVAVLLLSGLLLAKTTGRCAGAKSGSGSTRQRLHDEMEGDMGK